MEETMIIGEYNKNGYEIMNDKGESLYLAGNHPLDSSLVISNGLPITALRKFCIQTGKEMAKEQKTKWGGAIRRNDEN